MSAVQEHSQGGFSTQFNIPSILIHAVCSEYVKNRKLEDENFQLTYKIEKGNKYDVSNVEISSDDSDEIIKLLRQIKGFQQNVTKHYKNIPDFEIKKVISYCFKIAKNPNGVQDVFVKEHNNNTLLLIGRTESIDKFERYLDNFLNTARQDETEDRFTRKTRYQKLTTEGFKTLKQETQKTFFVIYNDENGLLKGELTEETMMEKIEQNYDVVCIQERFGDNVYNYEY